MDPIKFSPTDSTLDRLRNRVGQGTLTAPKKGAEMSPGEKRKLHETALEFESLLTLELLKGMEKTVAKSGFIDGGQGEKMFKEMLLGERAKVMSQKGRFGLADAMYEQFTGEKPPEPTGKVG